MAKADLLKMMMQGGRDALKYFYDEAASEMSKPVKNLKEREGIDCYDMLDQIKAKIDIASQKEPIQLLYVSV